MSISAAGNPEEGQLGTPARDRHSTTSVTFWMLLFTAMASVTAYVTMFAGFAAYDDEGAMMITVKRYLIGKTLYEDVFTIYGPVYYLYNWLLFTFPATLVTHDAVRLHSLIPCLAGSLICALIVLRLTGSLVMAGLTHLFCSQIIAAICRAEPGHPQEVVLILLLVFASFPLWAPILSRRNLLMISLGALSASLVLTKVNVGTLVLAALALTIAARLPPSRLSRLMAMGASLTCALMPLLLMKSRLEYSSARLYCWLVMASIAATAICVTSLSTKDPDARFSDGWLVGVGFSSAFAATLLIMAGQGVFPAALWDSLVLVPNRIFLMAGGYFDPLPLRSVSAIWALLGLMSAIYVVWRRPAPGSTAWQWLCGCKAAFSVGAMMLAPHVATTFSSHLLTYVTPFAWLVLFNPNDRNRGIQSFPRAFLCVLTVIQTVYAFPVAGSQLRLIQVLLFTVATVCAGDSLIWLRTAIGSRWQTHKRRLSQLALVGVALLYALVCSDLYRTYARLTPLDLPGASRLHVTPDQARDFQWLARNLRQSCDSFEGLPGVPSFNFWTGIDPLTGQNMDNWMISFTESQQRVVIAALARHDRACVVYSPDLLKVWGTRADLVESLPLARYFRENFRTVGNSGGYYLMVRNERGPSTLHIQ